MNKNEVPWWVAHFKRHMNAFYCILCQWNVHTTIHIWPPIFLYFRRSFPCSLGEIATAVNCGLSIFFLLVQKKLVWSPQLLWAGERHLMILYLFLNSVGVLSQECSHNSSLISLYSRCEGWHLPAKTYSSAYIAFMQTKHFPPHLECWNPLIGMDFTCILTSLDGS